MPVALPTTSGASVSTVALFPLFRLFCFWMWLGGIRDVEVLLGNFYAARLSGTFLA